MLTAIKGIFQKSVTVKEIHADFDHATERILQQANAVLTREEMTEKDEYLGLEKLGFSKLNQINEIKKTEKEKAIAKDTAEKIRYYTKHYPNNKFITDPEVKNICKKYGLFLGSVDD
jgi:hypothetical protein